MKNPYDPIFSGAAEKVKPEAVAFDLKECDSCKTFAKGVQPFAGRRLCEVCRMAEVNDAMRRAQRTGGIPAPTQEAARNGRCTYCPHAGPDLCQNENDRAACRHYASSPNSNLRSPNSDSLLKEPAHV